MRSRELLTGDSSYLKYRGSRFVAPRGKEQPIIACANAVIDDTEEVVGQFELA